MDTERVSEGLADAVPNQADVILYYTPFDGMTEGRLVIRGGLEDTNLDSDATMAELYTASCTARAPRRYSGGTVELAYPPLAVSTRKRSDVITLNGSIPLEIAIIGGIVNVRADLTPPAERSIDVAAQTARTTVDMRHPDGTVRIRLGAVSDAIIRRPAGVPVRVRIRRRSRSTTVDAQPLTTTVANGAAPPGSADVLFAANTWAARSAAGGVVQPSLDLG